MQARKHASEKSTLVLKPRPDVTRSPKQGHQWPHKKDSCPTKIFKKNLEKDWFPEDHETCIRIPVEGRLLNN